MTSRSEPPQAAPEVHAAADQCSIDEQLDAFEAIVRAAHDAALRSVTSTLTSDRWH